MLFILMMNVFNNTHILMHYESQFEHICLSTDIEPKKENHQEFGLK